MSYLVNFRGFEACPCLAEWLPVYERELQRRGLLDGPLHLYQLVGNGSASGGTHTKGGAFDVVNYGHEAASVARQMGADATWARTRAQGFMDHVHGVLTGCPHNEPARYQIAACQDGFNGLGSGGRGGRDDGPRPLSGRTWREGIAWAELQETDMKALVRDVRALTAKYNISLGMVARVALREARDGNKTTTSRGRSARAALLALKATNWGPEPK